MDRNDGFTVVELAVALMIVVVATAAALPRLVNPLRGTELQAAARDLATALERTRTRALVTGNDTTLRIDVAGRRYAADDRTVSTLPDDVDLQVTVADSEQRTATDGGIRFFADGSATGGRIRLRRADRGYSVDVNWLTGAVLVHADPQP